MFECFYADFLFLSLNSFRLVKYFVLPPLGKHYISYCQTPIKRSVQIIQ